MTKFKKGDTEPVGEAAIELHENLVKQTLKMNPGLAGSLDAKEFIEQQTGTFPGVTDLDFDEYHRQKAEEARPSVAIRTMSAFFKDERAKHKKFIADIRKQKEALDKEAATARRLTATTLARFLATNIRSADDLKAVIEQNQVFLQELAVSEKDLIKRVTELMRKLRK